MAKLLLIISYFAAAFLAFPALAAGNGTSTSLDELIKQLEECNPTLKSNALSVDRAQNQLDKIKAQRLPTFTMGADTFLRADGSDSEPDPTAKISAPLLTFGSQEATEAKGLLEIKYAEENYKTDLIEYLFNIFNKTLDLSLEEHKKAALLEIKERQDKIKDRLKNRITGGLAAPNDMLSINTKVERVNIDINRSENEIKLKLSEINALLCPNLSPPRDIIDQIAKKELSPDKATSFEKRKIQGQLTVERAELDVTKNQDNPVVQAFADTSIRDIDKATASRFGLAVEYSVKNLGQSKQAGLEQQENRIAALKLALDAEITKMNSTLENVKLEIKLLNDSLIPSQTDLLYAAEEKILSKNRLFYSQKATLFELLNSVDELRDYKLEIIQQIHTLKKNYLILWAHDESTFER